MNRIINDPIDEGWLALYICIIANVTTEHAFRLIENPESAGVYRKWTNEDLENVRAYRKEGLKWDEIGNIYNRTGPSMNRLYSRWRKGK